MIRKFCFILIFAFAIVDLQAQSVDADDSTQKNSFRAGLQFVSNQNFAGRTDSLNLPVIIPAIKWKTASGFYINTKGYLNLSQKSGFDGISIEPGFEFGKKPWDGAIALVKYFIKDSSNLIVAPINTEIEFYLSYNSKIISPNIGSEYVFSSEGNDLIIYAGLSKLITLTEKDKEPEITMEPSFSVSGGTQSFYYSFLKHHTIRRRGSTTQTTQKKSEQFDLLDTEIEMPVSISKGKFEGGITPAFEAPLNVITGSGSSQSSKSFFHFTAEVALNF